MLANQVHTLATHGAFVESWEHGTPHTLLSDFISIFASCSSPTRRHPDSTMTAIRSPVISAAAIGALRGFVRCRLAPCLAVPGRAATSASGKMLPHCALHASASSAGEAVAEPLVEAEPEAELSKLACPICYYPLVSSIDHQSAPTKFDSSLECSTCKKVYYNKDGYWDLTVAVGSTEYSESMPAATELFRL